MRRRSPLRSERGQSESVGVILLVAVVVTLVIGSGAVVIAEWQSEADRETQVNIQSELNTSELTLKHMGGDSLPPDDVLVVLQGDGGEELSLEEFTARDGNTRFEAGSLWTYSSLSLHGEITLFVFDASTNTLLHQKTYDVG